MIFSHQAGKVSVRTQQYRLDANGNLFDMEADPGQDQDLSGQQPELASKLRKAVAEWKAEVLPEASQDDRPFPVGYPEVSGHLPARAATVRATATSTAAPAPNCSFFTNWRSTDDRMTWDVEVARAGDYEVEVYYTCPRPTSARRSS